MSIVVDILGQSGSGKSRSIKGLDPKNTFLINVQSKPLPFRNTGFSEVGPENQKGNMVSIDNSEAIKKYIQLYSDKRPDIKNIVIDDFQYMMANEFMRRATEKGFEKFTDIGSKAWDLINTASHLRSNLIIYFLSHDEPATDNNCDRKQKTIGKMLDDKICLEGMFTIVLFTSVSDGKYCFLTQTNGHNTAKSPEGMFPAKIDNDLGLVEKGIRDYYQI